MTYSKSSTSRAVSWSTPAVDPFCIRWAADQAVLVSRVSRDPKAGAGQHGGVIRQAEPLAKWPQDLSGAATSYS